MAALEYLRPKSPQKLTITWTFILSLLLHLSTIILLIILLISGTSILPTTHSQSSTAVGQSYALASFSLPYHELFLSVNSSWFAMHMRWYVTGYCFMPTAPVAQFTRMNCTHHTTGRTFNMGDALAYIDQSPQLSEVGRFDGVVYQIPTWTAQEVLVGGVNTSAPLTLYLLGVVLAFVMLVLCLVDFFLKKRRRGIVRDVCRVGFFGWKIKWIVLLSLSSGFCIMIGSASLTRGAKYVVGELVNDVYNAKLVKDPEVGMGFLAAAWGAFMCSVLATVVLGWHVRAKRKMEAHERYLRNEADRLEWSRSMERRVSEEETRAQLELIDTPPLYCERDIRERDRSIDFARSTEGHALADLATSMELLRRAEAPVSRSHEEGEDNPPTYEEHVLDARVT